MEYSIEYEKIMAVVEDEVSREGAQAYSEDGGSLYDALRILSRDAEKMKRMMSEVLVTIKMQCNRFVRHASLEESPSEEPSSFVFELNLSPRRAAGKELSLMTIFRSMTANLIVNRFFASKNMTDLASKYDALALANVQSLNKLLYEKLPPVYPTQYEEGNDNNI